jgi:translation initiation factor IF-2
MEVKVGKITHFYDKIGVAVIVLSDNLKLGDPVHIVGRNTDINQQVQSMEIEHSKIQEGKKGQEVALALNAPARKGDKIFKVLE